MSVLPASVGGLVVGKHTLNKQATQLESLCGRIGRRLSYWLRANQGLLPSAEFLEAFRYYQAALLGLLREQRERAALVDGERGTMPVQSLEAQFRKELLIAAHAFTDVEWSTLDKVRELRTGPGRWVKEAE